RQQAARLRRGRRATHRAIGPHHRVPHRRRTARFTQRQAGGGDGRRLEHVPHARCAHDRGVPQARRAVRLRGCGARGVARHRALRAHRERRSHGAHRAAADRADAPFARGRRRRRLGTALSRAPHAPDTASHAATPGAARAAPHAAPLYIVPSLLGAVPPEDVLPARTLAIARELTHWIVETPKAARAFFGTLGMARPIAGLSIAPLAGHASDSEIDALLAPARDGHAMGLVSDAGAPGVADPGARVVAVAHRSGVRVVPLVGPSAVLLALMAAGLEGQRFAFHGY